jgi:hypothetical protein
MANVYKVSSYARVIHCSGIRGRLDVSDLFEVRLGDKIRNLA